MKTTAFAVLALSLCACGSADFSGVGTDALVAEGGQDVVDGGSDAGLEAALETGGSGGGTTGSGGEAGTGDSGSTGGGASVMDAATETAPRKTCEASACTGVCGGTCADAYTCKCQGGFSCNACPNACSAMGTINHGCGSNTCLCYF